MAIRTAFAAFMTLAVIGGATPVGSKLAWGQLGIDPDEAPRAAFLSCLEDTGDEEACLERLGRLAWYPATENDCADLAGRIEAVFSAGGMPRWPALFRNERCARLGMPHHLDAAAAGTPNFTDRAWTECYNEDYMLYRCDDIHGRHRRYYGRDDDCEAAGNLIGWEPFWPLLFDNERCWRLGMSHREPD